MTVEEKCSEACPVPLLKTWKSSSWVSRWIDHLRYLAIARYRERESSEMQGWGGKENIQPVLKALGNASGMPPLSLPQKFTQPFKSANPWEAEQGWPRPSLANLRNPLKFCPLKTNQLPPPPSFGVFEFLSLLPKPDFLFLRKKTFKIPLKKKKKASLRQLKHQRALRK